MVLNKKGEEIFSNEPTHPGEILADELDARTLTQKQLAEMLGVSGTFISELIRGKKSVSISLALALEKALSINASYWLNSQVQYNRNVAYLKAKRELTRLHVPPAKQKELLKVIAA